MDIKEKLVELILNADNDTNLEWYDLSDLCHGKGCAEYFADYLIAHNVTVQEWISVNERLPENFVSVLGYMTDAGDFPPVRECYTVGNAFFFPTLGDIHPVSHWCEMPQPPKGDKNDE